MDFVNIRHCPAATFSGKGSEVNCRRNHSLRKSQRLLFNRNGTNMMSSVTQIRKNVALSITYENHREYAVNRIRFLAWTLMGLMGYGYHPSSLILGGTVYGKCKAGRVYNIVSGKKRISVSGRSLFFVESN